MHFGVDFIHPHIFVQQQHHQTWIAYYFLLLLCELLLVSLPPFLMQSNWCKEYFTSKVLPITIADIVFEKKKKEKRGGRKEKDTRDLEICNPTKCPRDGNEKAHSCVLAYRQIVLWEKTRQSDNGEFRKGDGQSDGEVSIMRRSKKL